MVTLNISSYHAGFFSECTCKLSALINYYRDTRKLPDQINCESLYKRYKTDPNIDISDNFFENYNNINEEYKYENDIPYYYLFDIQFKNYKNENMEYIYPLIKKYFSPSKKILSYYSEIITKYNININNCVGLYYRGTDKKNETELDSFESYYNKLCDVIKNDNNIQILIQTDSAQFLDYMKDQCINKNIIIINENVTSYNDIGVHHESTNSENYIQMFNLFATFLIISKCKYIICSSGNCSLWMIYYRENTINVHQNINKKWM